MVCAALLTVLPVMGYAMCNDGHQAMSCAQGTVWDAATQSCVERVTG
ncbi:MAG: hypothetical protein EP318_01140 [Rhodobacteraceae bacterium]|nr:MAG: hypothetical protein EP318_01140 [Paracoccaceae bacterium]